MVRAQRSLSVYAGLVLGVALLLAGCARQSAPPPLRPLAGGVAPVLTVERFLNAVNSSDLDTMARLFGTRDGSVLNREPRSVVETWMYALASVLRHDNYLLEGEGIVPGRLGEAVELLVRMDVESRQVTVPFIVVQTRKDGWLIEQIGIERITSGRE